MRLTSPLPAFVLCFCTVLGAAACPTTQSNSEQSVVAHGNPPTLVASVKELFGDEVTSARLDDVALMFQQYPRTHIWIVTHPGPCDLPGKPVRVARSVRGYLEGRGIEPARFGDVIWGEAASSARVDLWVGDRPPDVPTSSPSAPTTQGRAILYDAFYVAFNCEELIEGWEDARARLDGFAEALRQGPGLRGHIVAYGARRLPGYAYPCPRFTRSELRSERDYLTRTQHIAGPRVVVEGGGLGETKMMELWLVPSQIRRPRKAAVSLGEMRGECPKAT